MCMAEYIGHNKKVCWTLCLTTSLTRMRMGREPFWWNLEDSMKFPEEKHQLGSSWPIPMTVMWGGSQRVWGPDPWCNPTNPKTKSLLGCQCQPSSSILSHDNIESNIFLQRVAWSRQTTRKSVSLLVPTKGKACGSFTRNQLQCRDVTWKVTRNYSAAATSNICNDT